MNMPPGSSLLALALCLCGFSCGRASRNAGPEYVSSRPYPQRVVYVFAVHPLHNPNKLYGSYQPLMDYLNKRIDGASFELEASRDYGHFEAKYRSKGPHLLLPNPWQTIQAMKVGYHVLASAGDPEDFKGLFIVRRDSAIQKPTDLKGKAVSYPSPTALAACIMPQYFLHDHGVRVRTDIDNRYVGSQESSIMNAYLGRTAAGATWPPPWRAFQKDHPDEAGQLKVLWETPSLINNSVMVREDVPSTIQKGILATLLHLQDTEEGRSILAAMETTRFHPASDGDYDLVRRYVARFEKDVRPVEGK